MEYLLILIGIILTFIGLLSMSFLWKIKVDPFLKDEAKRYFLNNNEMPEDWHSHGRLYRKGIALIEDKKTGKKKFIKTAQLVDIGILD